MFYGGSKLKKKILFKFFEFAYGFVRITPQKNSPTNVFDKSNEVEL